MNQYTASSNEELSPQVLLKQDTPSVATELAFDEIAQLAAQICQAPVAMINLVCDDQLKLKASHGITPQDVPADHSLCDFVRSDGGHELVLPDVSVDEHFRNLPCVTGEFGLRFYAGAPLLAPDGIVLGTICVLDRKPHEPRPELITALRTLSRQAVAQLELRHAIQLRQKETEQLRLMGLALNASSDGIVITDARLPDNPLIMANPAFERITGYSVEESIGHNCRFLQKNDHDQPALLTVRSALRKKQSCRVVLRNYRKDGRPFWNELHIAPVRDAKGETTHYIGIQSDITARKEADDALRQRDAILEGVNLAAETLLNEPNLAASLPAVLEQIGEATGSDHVCLWYELSTPDQASRLVPAKLWSNPNLPPENQTRLRTMTWDTACGWPKPVQLRQGRVLQKGSVDCNVEEQHLLQSLDIHTLLLLPVFTNEGHFWGSLSLGSAQRTTAWGFVEIETLRSAARVLGSVIHDRETSAALRISEERFRSVVTSLNEVVFQTNVDGLWTFLNPAWQEITGYSIEESVGKLHLSYVHPDDRERNNQLLQPLIERKKEYCRHEVRYITKLGGFRWVEIFARLVFDANNQITGTAGTLNDITVRKQADEALQKQRIAIEAAIDGVALLDDSGRYTYLNQTHVEMFGYSHPDELIGRDWQPLYSDSELARFTNEAHAELAKTGKWRGTVTATRRNGSTFAEEVSLTQIEGGGLVCVCRDITDRIEAEQFVLNALKEKEVMLKEIHHRVKNNMQIVSSLLNLQLDHLQDETARTMFIESQNRIASMALVHEKLYQSNDLSRIDFTDYLSDLTENLASILGAHTRNISFVLKSADVHLGIDTAIPCGLIINELVSNAYKHGFPKGGPGQVTLSLEALADGHLQLEVADNGRGIPPDLDLRKTKSLGMQLVHTLVQQLRGTLEVKRENGTRFIIRLQEYIRKEQHRP
ncbi:MAG: PAS domain S-box protein [Verrucomicrobia bacterium]|nr:PAS domain S-box protein [Verrucomicrobiota bacterium]